MIRLIFSLRIFPSFTFSQCYAQHSLGIDSVQLSVIPGSMIKIFLSYNHSMFHSLHTYASLKHSLGIVFSSVQLTVMAYAKPHLHVCTSKAYAG